MPSKFWILHKWHSARWCSTTVKCIPFEPKNRARDHSTSWQAVSRCANDMLMVVDFYYKCFWLKTLRKTTEKWTNDDGERNVRMLQAHPNILKPSAMSNVCSIHAFTLPLLSFSLAFSRQNCMSKPKKLQVTFIFWSYIRWHFWRKLMASGRRLLCNTIFTLSAFHFSSLIPFCALQFHLSKLDNAQKLPFTLIFGVQYLFSS